MSQKASETASILNDDYGPGLDGIDTAHIIGAAILGATAVLIGAGYFIHHAFITPSRQPRRTP